MHAKEDKRLGTTETKLPQKFIEDITPERQENEESTLEKSYAAPQLILNNSQERKIEKSEEDKVAIIRHPIIETEEKAQNNFPMAFILDLASRAGLRSINAFQIIYHMKMLAAAGKTYYTLEETILLISSYQKPGFFSESPLSAKSKRAAITQIFTTITLLKKNGVKFGEDEGRKIIDYHDLAKVLIILCGGSIRDKIEAIAALYGKFGITTLESNDFSDFCYTAFNLYSSYSKNHEDIDIASLSVATTEKCWQENHIPPNLPISQQKLTTYIASKDSQKELLPIFSKHEKQKEINSEIEESLEKMLNQDPSILNNILVQYFILCYLIKELRKRIGLDKIHVSDAMKMLKEKAGLGGDISRSTFTLGIIELLKKNNKIVEENIEKDEKKEEDSIIINKNSKSSVNYVSVFFNKE